MELAPWAVGTARGSGQRPETNGGGAENRLFVRKYSHAPRGMSKLSIFLAALTRIYCGEFDSRLRKKNNASTYVLAFFSGGGAENRTRVRAWSNTASTCVGN